MDDQEALTRARARRGEVIGKNYILGDVLGIGGMGVVHAALQRSLDRSVAVKLPRPGLAHEQAVRTLFRNEALAGSRMSHRNIVGVLDFGDDAGVPYLVMEHVAGPRLSQLLHEMGPLPIAAAIDLVRQVVSGLEDAHANGIVHADVKCDNVLVQTMRDGSLTPRIIDFGIARFLDEHGPAGSRTQLFVTGTPEYVAPEVARGQRPTPAADVYAIGVMLYELVTGTTPFGHGTAGAIMVRKVESDATSITLRYPQLEIPEEIDRLVVDMLARDPSARPTDAHELSRRIEATCTITPCSLAQRTPTPSIFSTEAVTASMAIELALDPAGRPALADRRLRVIAAIKAGDADRIATAYLELARALVEARQLPEAQAELEEAVELLMTPDGRGPVWRLLLSLATLYEHHGDHASARLAARAARDQAVDTGSSIGRARSERLCARLR